MSARLIKGRARTGGTYDRGRKDTSACSLQPSAGKASISGDRAQRPIAMEKQLERRVETAIGISDERGERAWARRRGGGGGGITQ